MTKRNPPGYWTLDRCKESALNFRTRKEWFRGGGYAYLSASRNKWLDECCTHMEQVRKPNRYWTRERCAESALAFQTRAAWFAGEVSAYLIATRNGWFDECCAHMMRPQAAFHSRTDGELATAALAYKTRTEWLRGNPKTFQYAKRHGTFETFCEHMPARANNVAQKAFAQHIRGIAPKGCEIQEEVRGLFANQRESIDIVAYRNGSAFLAIEYCGIYWHSEAKRPDRMYHERRRQECVAKGIRLIHLWEDVANDPRQLSVIENALGVKRPALRASKCELQEITSGEALPFFKANHPQGHSRADLFFGLLHDGRIVAAMSFRKSTDRYTGVGKYDWALHRFATDINLRVHGAASKLFAMRPAGAIVSYCDLDLFTGGVYAALGFRMLRVNPPGYCWVKSEKRISMYRAQKHLLPKLLGADFHADESEAENMRRCGWAKLWHSGIAVYAFPGNQ